VGKGELRFKSTWKGGGRLLLIGQIGNEGEGTTGPREEKQKKRMDVKSWRGGEGIRANCIQERVSRIATVISVSEPE